VDTTSRSRGAFCPRFASSFALIEIRGRKEDRMKRAGSRKPNKHDPDQTLTFDCR
jgi:hypothetical protein